MATYLRGPFRPGPTTNYLWSPDGQWLALHLAREGRSEISVPPVAQGGERVVLATWPAPVTELAWSPNSVYLALWPRRRP